MSWSLSDMHPVSLVPLAVALGLMLAWYLAMVETDEVSIYPGGGQSYRMTEQPNGTLVHWEWSSEGPVDYQFNSQESGDWTERSILYKGENATSADGAYIHETGMDYNLVFENEGTGRVDVEVVTDLRYSTDGLWLVGGAIAAFLTFPVVILAQAWRAED